MGSMNAKWQEKSIRYSRSNWTASSVDECIPTTKLCGLVPWKLVILAIAVRIPRDYGSCAKWCTNTGDISKWISSICKVRTASFKRKIHTNVFPSNCLGNVTLWNQGTRKLVSTLTHYEEEANKIMMANGWQWTIIVFKATIFDTRTIIPHSIHFSYYIMSIPFLYYIPLVIFEIKFSNSDSKWTPTEEPSPPLFLNCASLSSFSLPHNEVIYCHTTKRSDPDRCESQWLDSSSSSIGSWKAVFGIQFFDLGPQSNRAKLQHSTRIDFAAQHPVPIELQALYTNLWRTHFYGERKTSRHRWLCETTDPGSRTRIPSISTTAIPQWFTSSRWRSIHAVLQHQSGQLAGSRLLFPTCSFTSSATFCARDNNNSQYPWQRGFSTRF